MAQVRGERERGEREGGREGGGRKGGRETSKERWREGGRKGRKGGRECMKWRQERGIEGRRTALPADINIKKWQLTF